MPEKTEYKPTCIDFRAPSIFLFTLTFKVRTENVNSAACYRWRFRSDNIISVLQEKSLTLRKITDSSKNLPLEIIATCLFTKSWGKMRKTAKSNWFSALFNVKGVFYTIIISLLFIYCQYINGQYFWILRCLTSFKKHEPKIEWCKKSYRINNMMFLTEYLC